MAFSSVKQWAWRGASSPSPSRSFPLLPGGTGGPRGYGCPCSQDLADGGPRNKTAGGRGPRAHREGFQDDLDKLQVLLNARREEEGVNHEDPGGLMGSHLTSLKIGAAQTESSKLLGERLRGRFPEQEPEREELSWLRELDLLGGALGIQCCSGSRK